MQGTKYPRNTQEKTKHTRKKLKLKTEYPRNIIEIP